MEEIFATKIKINDVLNIQDFEIPLSETERRHLIITGKNGSGKTTVLNALKKNLTTHTQYESGTYDGTIGHYNELKNKKHLSDFDVDELETMEAWLEDLGKAVFLFNNFDKSIRPIVSQTKNKIRIMPPRRLGVLDFFLTGSFIIASFAAKRDPKLTAPSGIKQVELKPHYEIEDKAGLDFIQHMVNLKADESFAHRENELEEANSIDEWFKDFEEKLVDIFDAKGGHLHFDRKNYKFNIIEPGKAPSDLNHLSDGYSSVLGILSELIMRMEENKTKSYDVQGIVLIDEIETHLHIELQKKILPFLTSFFPKIQFIVTTHSPFVITSIENAVVCDLEKRKVFGQSDAYEGWSMEEVVKDILGVEETRNDTYIKLLEDFNTALDNENYEEAHSAYAQLDKMLHPESSLRKVLQIQLTGLVQHD